MKLRASTICLVLTVALSACTPATPPPITATAGTEFELAVGQTAAIADTDLSVTLTAVSSDERCPSEIECAASGPVSITVSISKGGGEAAEFPLQNFTDYSGRSPDMSFQGVQSQVEYEGYTFQMKGVTPYPKTRTSSIKASEYRVALIVMPMYSYVNLALRVFTLCG